MSYETKTAFLTAFDIIMTSKTKAEMIRRLAAIANVENVILDVKAFEQPENDEPLKE